MNALLVAPILLPLLGTVLCVLAWRRLRVQRTIAAVVGVMMLCAAVTLLFVVRDTGVQAVRLGGWAAPYGIAIVADLFSAIMVLLNAIVGVATIFYSFGSVDDARERGGYYPLLLAVLAGVSGAFLSGDLFNIYVWFEVMLMSSFALLALGGQRAQLEGAIKYVALNLLSSTVFLSAAGLLYGFTGTLNLADLAVKLRAVEHTPAIAGVAMLLLGSFSIKAGLFPFFFWLPASYHTPPVAVSALFAGLLTKVGVYAIVRAFTLVFEAELLGSSAVFLWLAGLTMVTGVLGAAAQNEMRRILSFHIVSQIGYMVMGLAVAGAAMAKARELQAAGADPALIEAMQAAAALSLAGAVFYILHHIIVKTNLFLVSGAVLKLRGSGEIYDIGGLYAQRPMLGLWFMVSAMSLAGIPFLSGFWAKLALVRGGLAAEEYWIVGVSLAVSLLTLFSMSKIWVNVFWAPQPENPPPLGALEASSARPPQSDRLGLAMYAPIVGLALVTLTIGLCAGPAFSLAQEAAGQLLDPTGYISAVLGPEAAEALTAGAAP